MVGGGSTNDKISKNNSDLYLYTALYTVYCSLLLCIALYYCVLLCITVYCSVLLCIALYYCVLLCITVYCSVLLCIALYYCVLLCITVYYSVLLCIALYSSVLLFIASGILVVYDSVGGRGITNHMGGREWSNQTYLTL